jgi:beta-lactamase regulating signal transducer with metallopeptidase domain
MEEQLCWIYAFNLVANSTLSFFTTILLIEIFMFLFRINHPRMKAICRALPFFKISLDLCYYHFSNWALLHGMNPILAKTGTRQLSIMLNPLTGIQLSMQDGKTFSIADIVALSMDPFWIRMIIFVTVTGSIIAISLRLVRIFQEKQYVSWILQESSPISFPNLNPSLSTWMEKRQITLAVSNEVTSPCIVRKRILFPAPLTNTLSQEEIEAVIAHEIAHCCWKDCDLRLVCSFIALTFWWIPSRWWQKQMEEMQEQAADAMIDRFGISQLALAKAVLKTARGTTEAPSVLVFPFVGRRKWLERRIHKILCRSPKPVAKWRIIQYGLLICSLLSILFGRLWIF